MAEIVDILNERGEYTGQTAERKVAHEQGLWHKGVVLIILSEDNSKILLQQRAETPGKPWPGFWDVSVGGHVDSGEYGYQTVVREAKEELGLDLDPHEMFFIGATASVSTDYGIVKHFNEYYIMNRDIDVSDLVFQESEVQGAKWFSIQELRDMMKDYSKLTNKRGCWNYILRYVETVNV